MQQLNDFFRHHAVPFLYGHLLSRWDRPSKPPYSKYKGKERHRAQAHEARHLWASGAGPRFPEDRHG